MPKKIIRPSDFKIKFEGQLHQVDANTFINSIINLSSIIQEINKELNKGDKIEIKIKALSEGSFLAHLSLLAKEASSKLFASDSWTTDIAGIVTILGGIIEIKKILGGKKPKKVEEKEDKVVISNDRGDIVIANNITYNIYNNNPAVQDSLSHTFETLQNDPSVEGFQILDEKDKEIVSVEREKFDQMSVLLEVTDKNTRVISEITDLTIFKVVFAESEKAESYKWEFYYRGYKISAKISDNSFFKSIDLGETFSKGDTLKVELHINQIFDAAINTWVNKTYDVKKVLSHTPRGKQLKIKEFNGKI